MDIKELSDKIWTAHIGKHLSYISSEDLKETILLMLNDGISIEDVETYINKLLGT